MIVDAVSGRLAPLTRYLAELGADVVRLRCDDSLGTALDDLAANNGKRVIPVGLEDAASEDVMDEAHAIVVDAGHASYLAELRNSRPALVTMCVSDFGTDTSLTDWHATDPVLHALSGELARSGVRGLPPLLPPGELAYECAAVQGAFVLVSAIYHALQTGVGDHIDFSALDGAVQALDPGFGIGGSATMGKPAHLLSRDRPARGFQYPIIPCADGFVRICLLAKRQWQGMFRWMGEPPEFAGAEFESTAHRYRSPNLLPAIAAFFRDRNRADLENEGQQFGVPIAAVLTFNECIASDHMRTRAAFANAQLPDGTTVTLPNGVVTVDDVRMTPQQGGFGRSAVTWPPARKNGSLPFEGLKVLDLGIIVVGAEQGRLFADGGADVVKVEARAYPDGNRQSYLDFGMSVSFAAGHRNKRSLGVNLRDPEGKATFLQLVANADIVLSNFKPGTMASLGLSVEDLASVNPSLVSIDSSAFGEGGQWSNRLGYGPLVRAATGLTLAWRYPDHPDEFSDSITIYPDHAAARIGALTAVSLLIRRLRTGKGGSANLAQAEVMLGHFAADVARASRSENFSGPNDWPWNAYPAAGDDEWCVITVRGTEDWRRLAAVIGYEDAGALSTPEARLAARDRIDAVLNNWVAAHDADVAMQSLQEAGVPAAKMLRVADLPEFTYYRERELFRVESHPFLNEAVIAERWAGKRAGAPEAPFAPAPLPGEQTEEVIREWLDGTVDPAPLARSGVLEPTDTATWAAARANVSGVRPIASVGA